MGNKITQNLFICDCKSTNHLMIFSYSEEENWNRVFVHVHLNPEHGFLKRLWHGLKYLFGYRSKFGDFDEFIFNPEDTYKLQNIVTYLKKCKDSNPKK